MSIGSDEPGHDAGVFDELAAIAGEEFDLLADEAANHRDAAESVGGAIGRIYEARARAADRKAAVWGNRAVAASEGKLYTGEDDDDWMSLTGSLRELHPARVVTASVAVPEVAPATVPATGAKRDPRNGDPFRIA